MKLSNKDFIAKVRELLKGTKIIRFEVDSQAEIREIEPKDQYRQYEPTGEVNVTIRLNLFRKGGK